MSYSLTFISEKDFENHVLETIKIYDEILKSIDLKRFNSNVIDPIKLTFDKLLFDESWESIIGHELERQRNKSDYNSIGFFHQNIFKYIANCEVPKVGFDVIYTDPKTKYRIFVEMKNKHNTMNSSAGQKTYMKFQNHLLTTRKTKCFLVEVIAKKSCDIPWVISLDYEKQSPNERLRRVSIDKFYAIVTGIDDAFMQICKQLPKTIEKLIKKNSVRTKEHDTVIEELKEQNADLMKAIYLLAFKTYNGFDKF